MPLIQHSHQVQVYPVREVPGAGGVVPVASDSPAYGFPCQITPLRAETAFAETGVMLRNPHRLMADAEMIRRLRYGDIVEDDRGQRYRVATHPRWWDVIPALSYGDVVLESYHEEMA